MWFSRARRRREALESLGALQRAMETLKEYDYEEVLTGLQEELRQAPCRGELWQMSALMRLGMGDATGARGDIAVALALQPGDLGHHELLAFILKGEGHTELAYAVLETAWRRWSGRHLGGRRGKELYFGMVERMPAGGAHGEITEH